MHTPLLTATAYSWPRVSTPSAAATGTDPMIRVRAASHQIISCRLACRSTIAPAGRAMSANASVPAAASNPTWKVVACRTTTAVSGSASWVTAEPISLTVCPLHSSRKLRCRQSERLWSYPGTASLCPGGGGLSNPGGRAGLCENGLQATREAEPVAAMKVTISAAMRARDVSRPHAEHVADAEAAEAAAGRTAGPAVPAVGVAVPAWRFAARRCLAPRFRARRCLARRFRARRCLAGGFGPGGARCGGSRAGGSPPGGARPGGSGPGGAGGLGRGG